DRGGFVRGSNGCSPSRNANCDEDANDGDHDHQLDEREPSLIPSFCIQGFHKCLLRAFTRTAVSLVPIYLYQARIIPVAVSLLHDSTDGTTLHGSRYILLTRPYLQCRMQTARCGTLNPLLAPELRVRSTKSIGFSKQSKP